MDTNEKRTIQFAKNCSPYLSGETATFPALQAQTLVTRGIAHYVKKDAKGNWVPLKGEKTDDNELLKTAVDADPEQEDDDGHESDDDSEGADGDDGDDSDDESDDDSDESDDDDGDDSDDGKKQAGRKRGRVKL